MAQFPPLHIFNEDDEAIGEAMLDEILEKGLLHRGVHVIIEDEAGKVLLQLRGQNVRTHPNTWYFAAAGYVDLGEDYEHAASRELKEELGITGVKLEKLGIFREHEIIGDYEVNRFVGLFKGLVPGDVKINISKTELNGIQWFDRDELKVLAFSDAPELTPYFKGWLQEHYFKDEDNSY